MNSKERVMLALAYQQPDRVPLNFFAAWNNSVRIKIKRELGMTVPEFCRWLHIDAYPSSVVRYPFGKRASMTMDSLDEFLGAKMSDPRSDEILDTVSDGKIFFTTRYAVEQFGGEHAVFAHLWGVLELLQFIFEENSRPGTEKALIHLALEREKAKHLLMRFGEWVAGCVDTVIDGGADAIELSDDWGQQDKMMINPRDWWELIYEPTKMIVGAARSRGVPVILHSDGYVEDVMDGLVEMGVNMMHPVQESAGHDLAAFKKRFGGRLGVLGGLDTISALPVMNEEDIRDEVDRVLGILKPGGGFIFSPSHMIQDDTPLPVVISAFQRAYEIGEYWDPVPEENKVPGTLSA